MEICTSYYYKLSDQIDATIIRFSQKVKNGNCQGIWYVVIKSVEEMLVSDFPMVVCECGIDSSVLTAMAKQSQPNIQLFTADI